MRFQLKSQFDQLESSYFYGFQTTIDSNWEFTKLEFNLNDFEILIGSPLKSKYGLMRSNRDFNLDLNERIEIFPSQFTLHFQSPHFVILSLRRKFSQTSRIRGFVHLFQIIKILITYCKETIFQSTKKQNV